jgi:hypothetical protein
LPLLVAFAAKLSTRAVEVRLDWVVLAFNVVVSIGTGVLVGVSSRSSVGRGTSPVSSRTGGSGSRHRAAGPGAPSSWRRWRSPAHLLIGAGLFLRSLHELSQVDIGIDLQHVQTARVGLDFTRYRRDRPVEGPGSWWTVSSSVSARHPEPSRSAWATPFRSAVHAVQRRVHRRWAGERRPATPGQATFNAVTPEYFRTLGIPVVKGRVFSGTDRNQDQPVVVVNQTLAPPSFLDRGSHRAAPLVRRGQAVGDHRRRRWGHPPAGPHHPGDGGGDRRLRRDRLQRPAACSSGVRRLPNAIVRQIRDAVRELDPQQPITEMRPLAEQRAQALAPHKLVASLLGLFAALALIITASGLIGVVAYSVSQRTREIGVRLALGAAPASVLRMVLGQGMALVVGGLCLGLAAAVFFGRLGQGCSSAWHRSIPSPTPRCRWCCWRSASPPAPSRRDRRRE